MGRCAASWSMCGGMIADATRAAPRGSGAPVRSRRCRAPGRRRSPSTTACRTAELRVYDDGYFGERVAARYDVSAAGMFDPAVVDPAVDVLAALAGSGRALELGIGTGRIALPLAGRGVPVHGIERSRAMVERLRAKPGSDGIGVTIGDFSSTIVDGRFAVAYVVFNTISNLTSQAAQVACFRNVAAHL